MGINTNLNTAPYHDDFDSTKQFIRVLFKPGRAVQARELTTLQSILQNQIERFGNNIYQEGTIIEGINPTVDKEINFVKIQDQSGTEIDDMTAYASTDDVSYFLRGTVTGLKAKIIAGANGFETEAPNLKTFFIKYLSSQEQATNPTLDQKEFKNGEPLTISRLSLLDDPDEVTGEPIEQDQFTVTTAKTTSDLNPDHVGKSLAVQVSDGVIYQHGAFNYVVPQLIIASKYNDSPDNISVGFDIVESVIDSALDQSLLDNAQGFNNQNAPGADRLKLEPKLAVYDTDLRPEDFFALLRIERGETVFVRGDTQFNSIKKELAKRTQDESGSYVVDGLEVTTEKDPLTGDLFATVGAGKAYVFGYEINNVGKTRVKIDPATTTNTKSQQSTGVYVGSYIRVNNPTYTGNSFPNQSLQFDFEVGEEYNLYFNLATPIGTCRVRDVRVDPLDPTKLRIYVYAVKKTSAGKDVSIKGIGPTYGAMLLVDPSENIVESNNSAMIFNTGRAGMKSVSDVKFVRRNRFTRSDSSQTSTVTITSTISNTFSAVPLNRPGMFAVTTTGQYLPIDSATDVSINGDNLDLTFDAQYNIEHVYYDEEISGVQPDTLSVAKNKWVISTYDATSNNAWLGMSNVLKIHKVLIGETEDGEDTIDVTNKFVLQKNIQDAYYGVSYLNLKPGESLPEGKSNVVVQFDYLARSGVGGYLSPNSYAGINKPSEFLDNYTARNGKNYNPLNSFDFRPYVDGGTLPSDDFSGAAGTNDQDDITDHKIYSSAINLISDSRILSQHEYYLGRIDKLAIDKSQSFVMVKGHPAEKPVKIVNDSLFGLADIIIPGFDTSTIGANAIKVERNTTRNYTMREIERIEKRVNKAYELISLNMLEQKTKDLFIPDGSGNNRFKNGIVVDQFQDTSVCDLLDSNYKASIDKGQKILAPAVSQFPVDLVIDDTTSLNISSYDDVTTLDSSSQKEQLLAQEYATTFRNLASNFYKYKGNVAMFPTFDAEYDVTANPDVTLNIDIETPLADLVDNIQEFVPLTTTTQTGTESDTTMEGNFRVTSITDSFETQSLEMNSVSQTQDLGTYISDFSMKPFMASKRIQIAIAGLRPNTRHHFFFDDVPVSVFVAPGTVYSDDIEAAQRSVKATDVFATGDIGDPVKTDEFGRLYAVFELPAERFLVGDADLIISDSDQYESIESAGTSIAKSTYHAYNFALSTTSIGSDVRSIDFDVGSTTFSTDREIREFVPPPPPPPAPAPVRPWVPTVRWTGWTRRWWFNNDPLAQTFTIQPAQAEYASVIFVDELDVFFKRKSPATRKNGVVAHIREVENGYPTAKVVPFGEKHIDWNFINTSDDGNTATKVVFDNPVKLEVGKEYAIVLEPDATDPDFFVWTARVGENQIDNDSVQVSSDWGSGMLFTSTNNKAWQSYQNEDLKFTLYKTVFSTDSGHIDFVPNDMEFFDVDRALAGPAYITNQGEGESENVTINEGQFFKNDEYAYVTTGLTNTATLITKTGKLSCNDRTLVFAEGEMVEISTTSGSSGYKHVSVVTNIATLDGAEIITLREAPVQISTAQGTEVPVTIRSAVGGKVVFFNSKDRTKLFIKESTSTQDKQYTISTIQPQVITGASTGATALITGIVNQPVSYIQPFVMDQNSLRTSTDLSLMRGAVPEAALGDNELGEGMGSLSTTYLSSDQRTIPSKQNILNEAVPNDVDRFRLRLKLDNSDYRFTSPVVDNTLSMLQAYNYRISDQESTTSQYVSKKFVLDPGVPAAGLKVLLTAFRPTGTIIDVQARFLKPRNPDEYSDWESLNNNNPDAFSSSGNIKDYREFIYDLALESDYDAFQLKIVLKHEDAGSGSNLFPHVSNYRAIAVT